MAAEGERQFTIQGPEYRPRTRQLHGPLTSAAVRCSALFGGRTRIRHQQVEDIGADPRRIAVPFIFPVTVNLPVGTCQRVPAVRAPPADRLMGLVKSAVRPEMG